MLRGSTCSAYSIQTDKDMINKSELMEEQVKVGLIGINDVGKSSMIGCIENQPFREGIHSTKGVQLRFKKLRMNNHAINLYLWDGPGQKMQEFIEDGQLNGMDGFLYTFDLTDKQSFHQLQQLQHMMKNQCQKAGKNICAVLVGNKVDLVSNTQQVEREIDFLAEAIFDYIQKLAKREQMLYLRVSAKNNTSVKDAFIELIKGVMASRGTGKSSRICYQSHESPNSKQIQQIKCECCKFFSGLQFCVII